ncbi:hypothetical protein [Stackebrandtia soli]|uniref:hypothetical protein n=1 Tax=Stackebrandtia soli TaxID=1892856 RepID=UPI0039E8BE32
MTKDVKPDKTERRRRLRRTRWLVTLLTVELVAALAAAGVFGTMAYLDWQESRDRAAAVDSARVTVQALMSISPTTLDENFAIVEENSTGEFAEQFTKTADTIRETVMTYATEQSAEVLRAAYSDGDSDSATILLAVDATTIHKNPVGSEEDEKKKDDGKDKDGEEADGADREPIDSHYRIKAQMALVDGVWLLAELEMST